MVGATGLAGLGVGGIVDGGVGVVAAPAWLTRDGSSAFSPPLRDGLGPV